MAKRVAFTYTYDDFTGEGATLRFSKEFKGDNGLLRADVLQDAIGELERAYNTALDDVRAETAAQD